MRVKAELIDGQNDVDEDARGKARVDVLAVSILCCGVLYGLVVGVKKC